MTATITRRMTEEEFLRLPDDGRKYELVDGEPKEVPAGHKHDAIGFNVGFLLKPHARGRGILAGSQAGFRMQNGNIRSPDVSFTLKSRLVDGQPSDGFENLAPDLCIEIISPSEEREEMMRKVREYFGAGAQFVWHLFPEPKTARVYTSPEAFTDYGSEDEIEGGDLLPGFRCRVADLFVLE
jgi:Uma2 family endonuclease